MAAGGIAYGEAACPTSGTTPVALAISVDCKGKTPKGCILTLTRSTAVDNGMGGPLTVAGALISQGMSDGTTTLCNASVSEDGEGTAANIGTARQRTDDHILTIFATDGQTVEGQVEFVSFAADTINVELSDVPATAMLIKAEAWYGDDCEVAVRVLSGAVVLNGTNSITGLAFRPRGGRVMSSRDGYANDTATNAGIFMQGAFALDEDGTVVGQFCHGFHERTAPTASAAVGSVLRDDAVCVRIAVVAAGTVTEEARHAVISGEADGITIQTTAPASPSPLVAGYFLFRFGNRRTWAGIPSFSTTSTGVKNITDPGWRPSELHQVGTRLDTLNTYYSSGSPNSSFCTGSANDTGQYSCSYKSLDNALPTSTHCSVQDYLSRVINDGTGSSWVASFDGFTATGWDEDILSASSTARLSGALAIERPRGWVPRHRIWRHQLARM